MRLSTALYFSITLPFVTPLHLPILNVRNAIPAADLISHPSAQVSSRSNEIATLEKRRGGGGGGGGGRGGGGSSSGSRSSSSSSGSSGSSRSGSSSSGGSSGGGRSGGSSTPSSGFSSSKPSYAGGRSYAGGATTPYSAGAKTARGIVPLLLVAGAITFFGVWAFAAYSYPYAHRYPYYNRTNNQNETLPVTCYCQQYSSCGCDDTDNTTTIAEVLKNDSVAKITEINGTRTVVIDGTLPNGTDPSFEAGDESAAPGIKQLLKEASGFWAMGAVVGLMVWGL